jgi:hypothetical protein
MGNTTFDIRPVVLETLFQRELAWFLLISERQCRPTDHSDDSVKLILHKLHYKCL